MVCDLLLCTAGSFRVKKIKQLLWTNLILMTSLTPWYGSSQEGNRYNLSLLSVFPICLESLVAISIAELNIWMLCLSSLEARDSEDSLQRRRCVNNSHLLAWSLGGGMATHASILAWKNPMDWGAWRATVHGVARESDMTEHTSYPSGLILFSTTDTACEVCLGYITLESFLLSPQFWSLNIPRIAMASVIKTHTHKMQ